MESLVKKGAMKRWALLVIFMTAVAVFAGGFNYTIAAAKPTKIRVGAMPYYLSVPLQVIKDEKLDEKYGFDLEVIGFPSGGPMAEALGAGQWDIGPIGAGGMIAIPTYNAKLIADVELDMDGAWIMARPNSDIVKAGSHIAKYPEVIGSKAAIKGKTILGTIGNISHYMALDYIKLFGLGMKDVKFVHMETSQVYTAFVAGNGDLACIGSPAAGVKLRDQGYKIVGGLKQQGKSQQDALLVSEKFYKQNYKDCINFMKAWYRATDKLNGNPEYEVEMTKKFYKLSGRTDFTDAGVREECSWNTYIDSKNAFQKKTGVWMTGLVKFMVDNKTMDKQVLDAMGINIKLDIVKDAIKQLKAEK